MKHLIESLNPLKVYCGVDAPPFSETVTASYEDFTCEECKKRLYQYWAGLPEETQTILRDRYNLRPIIHHGIPTFEVEEIPPKYEYQEKLYPKIEEPFHLQDDPENVRERMSNQKSAYGRAQRLCGDLQKERGNYKNLVDCLGRTSGANRDTLEGLETESRAKAAQLEKDVHKVTQEMDREELDRFVWKMIRDLYM